MDSVRSVYSNLSVTETVDSDAIELQWRMDALSKPIDSVIMVECPQTSSQHTFANDFGLLTISTPVQSYRWTFQASGKTSLTASPRSP